MYSTFQIGQRYLNTLPNQKKLSLFLPDYHWIQLVKFAIKTMPIFAFFSLIWQCWFGGNDQITLANSIIITLFALGIPFQGLFLLGKRAQAPLPASLLQWYEILRQQLILEQHTIVEQAVPSYQDFANLLQLAEKTWGEEYFNEL